MKSIFLIATLFTAFTSSAQTNSSVFIRHDTTILKAAECEWMIRSLIKNDPAFTADLGKPIALVLFNAIENGKLKAFEYPSNQPIPGKDIRIWKMPVDSIMMYDSLGNSTIGTVQRKRNSDEITQIKVYHDWWFDLATSQFYSIPKWIDVMADVKNYAGIFIGHAVICRIYY
ncbi:MAG TPA: hypothetical protein VKH37_06500 [Ferruginibacter sp.]|nr:hypothetical protein [Ferruginibacter sp.]